MTRELMYAIRDLAMLCYTSEQCCGFLPFPLTKLELDHTLVAGITSDQFFPRLSAPLPLDTFVEPKLLFRIVSPDCATPFSRTNWTTSMSLCVPNTVSSCWFDGLLRRPCAPWLENNTWKAVRVSNDQTQYHNEQRIHTIYHICQRNGAVIDKLFSYRTLEAKYEKILRVCEHGVSAEA